jgi:hypothetical protein
MTFLPIRLKHLLALKNKSKKTSPVSHSAENLHELDRYNNSKPLSFLRHLAIINTPSQLYKMSEYFLIHSSYHHVGN